VVAVKIYRLYFPFFQAIIRDYIFGIADMINTGDFKIGSFPSLLPVTSF